MTLAKYRPRKKPIRLTLEQKKLLLVDSKDMSVRQLCRKYNVSQQTVSKILRAGGELPPFASKVQVDTTSYTSSYVLLKIVSGKVVATDQAATLPGLLALIIND